MSVYRQGGCVRGRGVMWDFLLWGGIVFFLGGGGIFKKGDFYMQLGFFCVGGGCGQ